MVRIFCRGILFDLDGTLVDSGDAVVSVWSEFARSINLEPEAILVDCHGKRTVEVVSLVAPDLPLEATVAKVEGSIAELGAEPTAGAVSLLKSLRPSSWAVVTSSTAELAQSRFDLTELPAPRELVTSEDVKEGKPHPAGYVLGAQLLGIPVSQCLVVEDAPMGVAAGKAAGMRTLGVTTTHPAGALDDADHVVSGLNRVSLLGVDESTGSLELELTDH